MAREQLEPSYVEAVPDDPRVERRRMFGGPAATIGGHMFMGLMGERLIFRLGEPGAAEFERRWGESGFGREGQRPMRGWVVAPAALVADAGELQNVARLALEFAAALPPKAVGGRSKGAPRRTGRPDGSA